MAKKKLFASCDIEIKSGKLSPKNYDGLLVALFQDEKLPKEVFGGIKLEGDPESRIKELIKNKEIRASFREFTILHFTAGKKVQRVIVMGLGKRDKAKTDKAWRGDFFTVGDAGYLDEDGFLFLCDRKSDMIISGGVNIYPAEIECEMILHPKIADVAVFGIPHDDWGEEVKAVVELLPGQTPSEELVEDIKKFCTDRIAKYKMPRTIDFIDQLPREANGKLMKRKLRDPYWEGRDRAI